MLGTALSANPISALAPGDATPGATVTAEAALNPQGIATAIVSNPIAALLSGAERRVLFAITIEAAKVRF